MSAKLWNWRLWIGFGLSLAALAVYILLFETTRAVFWPSLALFVVAAAILIAGLRRSSREPQLYRGKIAGPILAVLSLVIFGLFGFASYEVHKAFPAAANAPKVGQRAPEFALADTSGKSFSLAQLLSTPVTNSSGTSQAAKGVLVFFYRGYW